LDAYLVKAKADMLALLKQNKVIILKWFAFLILYCIFVIYSEYTI
jgi:hypothetical protein